MTAAMKVEMWPIDKPVAYANNARMLSPHAVDKVAASIKEFGFRQPIVVDKEGVIAVGHTRLLAAKKLGLSTVPVVVADDLTPAAIKAFRLADNRTAQESSWDYELLAVELEELAEFPEDMMLSTGFDRDEIDGMILDEPEISEYSSELEAEDEETDPEDALTECPKCKYRWMT